MIIGIHGKAGSGKTTVTNMLMDIIPSCSTDSFAKPIKEMLEVIGVHCTDDNKNVVHPLYGKTPRQMMQSLGNEWGRNKVTENLWIEALDLRTRNINLIISDVRRENEADYVRGQNNSERAVIIHIIGRGGLTGAEGQDISESGIEVKPGDIVIDNSPSLDADTKEASLLVLRNKVLEALVQAMLK